MMNRYSITLIFAITFAFPSTAQLGTDTIAKEFNELIEASNSYQGYKVVNYNDLTRLRDNTIARVEELREEIAAQEEVAERQLARVDSLEADLNATKKDLEEVNEEKDAIRFLGMPLSKGSYKGMMWGIVGILVLALLFFIYKYKNSQATTREARENLRDTEQDFDAYRTKALEKEQRLGRQLQDERNKANNS